MSQNEFKPFVPAKTDMAELTLKAMIAGIAMAVVLGAANAYLGMKAGLTVAATFPAAVVAMAVLKPFGGTILEENIARTTASVGEALIAGAIFTIPAFVISGVWETLQWFESTMIMMIGGVLGVLFVIMLRRSLVVEADLPFPESVAASQIVKAGQGGESGASLVFGSMGIAGLWELLKNSNGLHLVKDTVNTFVEFGQSKILILQDKINYKGGFLFESPAASPALMGVGYIVGLRVASVLFSGAVMGWMFLVPVALFLNPELTVGLNSVESWIGMAEEVWFRQIRPLAVGTMIVAAFYTLYNLKDSLVTGIKKALGDVGSDSGSENEERSRLEIDISFKKILMFVGIIAVPLYFLYLHFSSSVGGSLLLTVVMIILGFLFTAVAGYLVGLVGSSNNPISGLTLSSLLIAAVLMVLIGVTGDEGVKAVLAVAGVVCVAAGVAGDMMQDLKVGHILGGTPWKMEVGEIIGVIFAAAVLIWPMIAMDEVYGIGTKDLPAPQAGLMALMSRGIVGGEMAWTLVIAGMFLAVALILIKSPSPMLIAVGMYLPFFSTAAIFVGGIVKWLMDRKLEKENASDERKAKAENSGVLIASGLIAGEALMAVLVAFMVLGLSMGQIEFSLTSLVGGFSSAWLGLIAFAAFAWFMIKIPMDRSNQ
jgi:putative OPT family oligopeptide transporter